MSWELEIDGAADFVRAIESDDGNNFASLLQTNPKIVSEADKVRNNYFLFNKIK